MAVIVNDNAQLLGTDTAHIRTPMIDLAIGGQNGVMRTPQEWASSANYVKQKLRAVLLTAPEGLQYLPDAAHQYAALKSLIELMPQSIDGLTSNVEWSYDGHQVGHAGEKMESVTQATRAVCTPTFTWAEKYGLAVARFWTEYGRMLIMDPDLTHPGIIAEPNYLAAGSPAWLPNMYAMTVLFFEPDVTFTKPTSAWLCTNMQPRTGGDITGKMEVNSANELSTPSIEFTSLALIGNPVLDLASQYLKSLKMTDMRPLDLVPYTDVIDPEVRAAAEGLASQITNAVINP